MPENFTNAEDATQFIYEHAASHPKSALPAWLEKIKTRDVDRGNIGSYELITTGQDQPTSINIQGLQWFLKSMENLATDFSYGLMRPMLHSGNQIQHEVAAIRDTLAQILYKGYRKGHKSILQNRLEDFQLFAEEGMGGIKLPMESPLSVPDYSGSDATYGSLPAILQLVHVPFVPGGVKPTHFEGDPVSISIHTQLPDEETTEALTPILTDPGLDCTNLSDILSSLASSSRPGDNIRNPKLVRKATVLQLLEVLRLRQ
jgi:hypothetical protein